MSEQSKGIDSVKVILVALVIVLSGFSGVLYYQNIQLSSQFSTLQASYNNLASSYNDLHTSINNLQASYNSLQSSYNNLQTSKNSLQSQIAGLNATIVSLESQLLNATALIAQLQGPTGILPVYMDLGYIGATLYGGAYFLQLSLKNTGSVPITQIFVTLASVQITMSFTYLNTTVSADTPLPSYQTAIGLKNVTPPITNKGTYPLIIQAIATNGTIYTYQTTINAHI